MTHDLVFTRQFNAAVDQVWRTWSESEYVRQWWEPNGFIDMHLREGGTSFVCMRSPNFGTLCNTCTYTKIVPKERIEFTLKWVDEEGNIVGPAEAGVQADLPDEMFHKITIKDLGTHPVELELEQTKVIEASGVTHLRYQVKK
ncbi:MAG: SRPBCC domain-containing protein [Balneolaceae bacterium]|nr:SRPBCC domain-containing protein [Balneolaceae bacterium]